jgi:peroxiredoxin
MVALLATLVALFGALLTVLVMVGGWVLYGLLRQNGRMLLRIDALEAALDGAAERPSGRVFADRSLAKSRINRSGLAKGTAAPDFRLPMLDGGEATLAAYAGRRLLLVFSDPSCAPCMALLPKLQAASRQSDVAILVISRGGIDANRRKLADCNVVLPVALQAHWEISRLYAKFVTPVAYLIDEQGRIAADPAEGGTAILTLLSIGEAELRQPPLIGHGPGSRLTH